MKVKFIQSVSTAKKTYQFGDVDTFEDKIAKSYIDAKFAVEVETKSKDIKTEDKVAVIEAGEKVTPQEKPKRTPRKGKAE